MKFQFLSGCRKIWILGAVASGKTTLARELAQSKSCYYYELDQLVHIRRKNVDLRRSSNEILEIVNQIKRYKDWIIEGVYRKDYHFLLEEVDCIIVLETPSSEREYRIFTRWVKQNYGYESCSYKPSLDMLKNIYRWIEDYDTNFHNLQETLKPYAIKVIYLQSDRLNETHSI